MDCRRIRDPASMKDSKQPFPIRIFTLPLEGGEWAQDMSTSPAPAR
jgi:hypothetical protein